MQSFRAEQTRTIKQCLNYLYPFLSDKQIEILLSKKDIKVNGNRIKTNITLNVNDFVEVYFDFERYLSNLVKTIYKDENIIIVNKPQGIETTSNDTNKLTLEKFLQFSNSFVKAVHRIDLNTKGLVIFALNDLAEKELLIAIKKHKINKIYNAIVYSNNTIKCGQLKDYLFLDKEEQTAKISTKNTGKVAILEIIESKILMEKIYLITIKLLTGRMHQIRAQLSHRKIFVVGDGKYGDKTINRKLKKNKQMLQATEITFNLDNENTLSYLNQKKFKIDFEFNLY